MLGWAIAFLIAALFAAAIGFGAVGGASAVVARMLFFVFLALSAGTMLRRLANGKPPV